LVGIATVVLVNVGVGVAIMNGFGSLVMHGPVESEVVIIEEVVEVEDEPPPPPPIDVELPPPPPQVILPDFVFDTPPPQVNAVTQVVNTPNPTPPPVKAAPPPPPAVTLKSRPKPGRRFEKPEYPAAALRAGEEGDVVVSVCVDKDGRMSDVKLVKSSGSQRLDDATIKGLARTRLDPAIGTDGKPIAMCNPNYQFTLTWDLEEAKR
jgi:protein TonB